jgi:hypothetical protein
MVCFPPLVLSLTVSVAEREPIAVGVKVTAIRQVASGLIVPDVGQVLAEVILKSPGFAPVSVVLVMVSVAVLLVSVRVDVIAELVEPWTTEPKFSEAGSSVAVGSAVPVPLRAMVCFRALVLSLIVSVAERDPVLVGVKVTEIRHVASGLIVPALGHVLAEVILKSPGFAPVSVVLVMVSVAVLLVSVSVDVFAELVEPWVTEPKFSEAGSSVAVGSAVPVPERAMV